jgi:hypothetical protein
MRLTEVMCLLCLLAWCSAWSAQAAATFFVAANGSDGNPGTRDHPFATLERARDEIRKLDKSKLAGGSIIVEVAAATDSDGGDDHIGAGENVAAVGGGFKGDGRVPRLHHLLDQAASDVEGPFVNVYQADGEAGAARTDEDDLAVPHLILE